MYNGQREVMVMLTVSWAEDRESTRQAERAIGKCLNGHSHVPLTIGNKKQLQVRNDKPLVCIGKKLDKMRSELIWLRIVHVDLNIDVVSLALALQHLHGKAANESMRDVVLCEDAREDLGSLLHDGFAGRHGDLN